MLAEGIVAVVHNSISSHLQLESRMQVGVDPVQL